MRMNEDYDWLGICLEMMLEYLPIEVTTKTESKKFWEINSHLVCILELSGLTRRPGTSQRADYLNDFMKDFIRIFNLKVTESTISESADDKFDGENNFDNAVLNNILLYSLVVNSEESEPK